MAVPALGRKEIVPVAALEDATRYGYSQCVRVGPLVYIAGQCGLGLDHEVVSPEFEPQARAALDRVRAAVEAAGGTFGPHIDDYEHVFSVQAGHGEAMVGKLRRPIAPGDIITTDINEPHGLWASPDEDLVLVTANIYQQ